MLTIHAHGWLTIEFLFQLIISRTGASPIVDAHIQSLLLHLRESSTSRLLHWTHRIGNVDLAFVLGTFSFDRHDCVKIHAKRYWSSTMILCEELGCLKYNEILCINKSIFKCYSSFISLCVGCCKTQHNSDIKNMKNIYLHLFEAKGSLTAHN